MPNVKKISESQLEAFVAENRTLIIDAFDRPAMMLTPRGEMVKSFFRKDRISKSIFFPKGVQFAKNGERLKIKGLLAPYPKEVFYCPERRTHMVVYDRLPGTDLRELHEAGDDTGLKCLPEYLVKLHDLGIYFRSIHLGNILWTENGDFGLIDIADVSIKSNPLGNRRRIKNLAHLLGTEDDREIFCQYGPALFLDEYCHYAKFNKEQAKHLQKRIASDTAGNIVIR